ncbi:MAG: hypothetical protein LC798_16900 [Chloroflexi bacterium]|nr:hypothetical protein [Chloroflexota bacterium]
MPPISRFELVNQVLDGRLPQILGDLRAAKVSYDEMVRHFEALGVAVSRETLRRWAKQVEDGAAA